MGNIQVTYTKSLRCKRDLYNENNSRNRCQYTLAQSLDFLKGLDKIEEISPEITRETENNLNELIDSKEETQEVFDFAAEGYEQVSTKGGLRWKKIT
jgi:hypothetical protein